MTPEKRREYARKWMKKRVESDIIFRIHKTLRCRMNHYFRGQKPRRTRDLVGTDFEFIKKYIENQFTKGMTWDNYGKWHVDHIIPISSAKTLEEIIPLWHYTNLQPLWAKENLKKGKKIIKNRP